MSDFIFSTRPRPAGELERILRRWLDPVSAEIVERTGAWGTLAVARAAHDPQPVVEDARGTSVLIGEPLARMERMPAGAAAEAERRAALHRALLDGEMGGWEDRLDGPFAALAVDAAGGGILVTDLFAWITVFAAEPRRDGDPLVVGTHVDAVAEAAGARGAVDPVAAAELIGYYRIHWPRTLYPAVRQTGPGAVRRFGTGGWMGAERAYWRPVEEDRYDSLADAATALRTALVDEVRLAVDGHPRVGMLLSGGEDARAVLGAMPADVEVRGFMYGEGENREVRSARRVARAYGASLDFRARPPGYDLVHLDAVAAMVGSQNEFVDVHNYGLAKEMGIDQLPVVLGGFSSDALLKGDNVRRWARRRLDAGQAPGIRAARPPVLPGVREELLREAARRRTAFREWLAEMRPESADEWSFIYPFAMRQYAAGLHGNRRLFRTHEPFMSNPVARLASAVPQRWKLDRKLFHAAVRPLLARSWYVPHTRNRLPYFGAAVNAAARPLLGISRGARALAAGERGANQESWPVWDDVVRTPLMEEKLREHPLAESGLGALFADASSVAQSVSRWPALSRLAALQLACISRA